MAFNRRSFAGGAVEAHLNAQIDSAALIITVDVDTGWPSGGVTGPFSLVMNRGGNNEEKALIDSVSGTTLTVNPAGRGYDGTGAATHAAGEPLELCLTAVDLDEANQAVVATLGNAVAKGDLLVATGPNTLTRLPVGADSKFLVADSAFTDGVAWENIPTGAINDPTQFAAGVINNAALASNSVTTDKITDGTIVTADLADLAVTNAKIADATIAPGKIAAGASLVIYQASQPSTTAGVAVHWIDTAKGREWFFDGTVWRFLGGKAYFFQGENTGTHDLVDGQWNIEPLSEIQDSDTMHSATDQFVTCPLTGLWECEVEAIFQNAANDLHTIGLGFNVGTTFSTGTTAPTYSGELTYTNDTSALTNNPRRHYARTVLVTAGQLVTPCWWSHIASGTGRVLYCSFQARYVGSLT